MYRIGGPCSARMNWTRRPVNLTKSRARKIACTDLPPCRVCRTWKCTAAALPTFQRPNTWRLSMSKGFPQSKRGQEYWININFLTYQVLVLNDVIDILVFGFRNCFFWSPWSRTRFQVVLTILCCACECWFWIAWRAQGYWKDLIEFHFAVRASAWRLCMRLSPRYLKYARLT